MILLAEDQVRMCVCVCLFVRLFKLLSFLFLFLCIQYAICQTFSLYYAPLRIYICEAYTIFYDQTKRFFQEQTKDCSIICSSFFFLSLFLLFVSFFFLSFGLLPIKRNIRLECDRFPDYNFRR